MDNPYVELTAQLNAGRLRALLASGQAVVLYRLAIMSKDGDWILREDRETLDHVLATLEGHRARYRFGAPLDLRWLEHGWSSHFEHRDGDLRLRCDFVTRPPRVAPEILAAEFAAPVMRAAPIVSLPVLADLKKTNREKDYAVIGELARLMEDPATALRYSRSARDILHLAVEHPEAVAAVRTDRPLLAQVDLGREAVERALDEERRALIRVNEARLERYLDAAQEWSRRWPRLADRISGLPLRQAHAMMVTEAEGVLPFAP